MPTIIHFDISADDIQRAKDFYGKLFGWKIEKFPGPMEYYLIETEDAEGKKGIGGGIAKREKPYQKVTNFIQVSSVDEFIKKVKKLGGKIIESKTAIPGVGYIAGCKDTEDNIFGLIEVDKNANDGGVRNFFAPFSCLVTLRSHLVLRIEQRLIRRFAGLLKFLKS